MPSGNPVFDPRFNVGIQITDRQNGDKMTENVDLI
jgi:hypothetical protein